MKVKLILCALFFITFSLFAQSVGEPIIIGKRYSIESKILSQTRNYAVYLPPSYGTSEQFRYPVFYMIDGEYNFHHVTGLVEQLSSISEKIPEMIVVGISDAGQPDYVKNSTPYDEKSNPDGQSEKFLKFITDELKPIIKNQYPSAEFDLLAGHSLGGLFTVNAFLNKPESFNAYIAISPSLWWNDYEAEKKVAPFFDKNEHIDRFLYLSVGDEVGMGIAGFYDQINIKTFEDDYLKKEPMALDYTFRHFPDDNHGSVGMITVDQALRKLFKNYYLPYQTLKRIKSFDTFAGYMQPYADMIGKGFRIPARHLTSVVKSLYENESEIAVAEKIIKEKFPASLADFYIALAKNYSKSLTHEKAVALLEENCRLHPQSPECLAALAEAYDAKKDSKKAKDLYQKAFDMAEKNGARQWYLNHLMGHISKIK